MLVTSQGNAKINTRNKSPKSGNTMHFKIRSRC